MVPTPIGVTISEGDSSPFPEEAAETSFQNNNQPSLRRFDRTPVFPNKYNEYVIHSKVKFSHEKIGNYSKLSFENFCFVTELNKFVQPKTYRQACKD